jgi:2-C-methyl-D-erythritol 2,4-cyclodiphosphate synthase
LHALTDAILGAIDHPDIGELFPDNDPANAGRDSAEFLTHALALAERLGYRVNNADLTIVLERPKLSPFKHAIKTTLTRLLGLAPGGVNVKAKTHEGLDSLGRGEAIEAHTVVLMVNFKMRA